MGKNCIEEVLKKNPRQIKALFTSKREDPLLQKLKDHNIPIHFVPKLHLNALVQSQSHQSFVAKTKPRRYRCLPTFLQKSRDRTLLLLCDSVEDPQNFGAILRAAECFGIDGVIWSKNRNVEITPVVSKVSVGASELVDLFPISNAVETTKKIEKAGYSIITAERISGAASLFSFSFPQRTLLIIGSEEKGIRPLLRKQAQYRVEIPLYGQIDSLNVAQATSIFLAHWRAHCERLLPPTTDRPHGEP